MTVYETHIRTGNPVGDQQMLEQLRRQYQMPGLALQVQPLSGGGMHVRVVQQYGVPSQPPNPYSSRPPMPYGAPNSYGRPQQAYVSAPSAYSAAPAAPAAGGFAGGIQAAVDSLDARRVRYLRKVYGLLAISSVFAIAAGWISTSPLLGSIPIRLDAGKVIQAPLIAGMMLENRQLEYGAFALLVVGVLIASMVSKVRGLNYLALFGVSALMGVELAPMAFVAQVMAGMGRTVTTSPIEATFAMVGAIFIGLTSYVFIARKNFSYLWATLSMGFWVVLAGCVVSQLIDSEPFTLAIASVGALLSIGFLLYQTSWIFRNSDMDDPVDDALGLIVQLRNLFMFILRMFMRR